MDKKKERIGIDDLINHLNGWSLTKCGESPDFIIRNDSTHCLAGVEVTDYYPNRTQKGVALVKIPGKDKAETRRNKLRFFEKTEFGYARFAPRLRIEDFMKSCIEKKEGKLGLYRKNAPNCNEFWLLIMLDHNDNVLYEDAPSISSAFDRIFIWEEPHSVSEFQSKKR
jgi:hypothetical protein